MKFLFLFPLLISFSLLAKEQKAQKSRFEELELFNKVIYLIESSYYREVDTTKLIEGAIKGMMQTLDPHSAYLGRDNFKKMQNETKGEFGGLGIEVTTKDGHIYVITPIDDTPAFKKGVMAGDKIVDIDGESTLGMTLQEAVQKMRGKIGTTIDLGIVRSGVEGVKRFKIERSVIQVKPVKHFVLDNHYGLIRLTQFTQKASSSIEESIKSLQKKAQKQGGLKGLILDLRSNPGGLLDEAVNVASIFLDEGVVVSTEPRDDKDKEIRYVNKDIFKEAKLPLVVLINGASASASEIVAGALQDHGRAIIMGSRSFGKGSVQQVAKIDDEVGVKLTIAQYMTPKNRKIQAKGIEPDIALENIDGEVYKNNLKSDTYIREVDLKNHLNATIETEEEKKDRLEREREARIERIQEINRRKNRQESAKENEFRKYDPSVDYQVIMALNHLKAYEVIEKISQK